MSRDMLELHCERMFSALMSAAPILAASGESVARTKVETALDLAKDGYSEKYLTDHFFEYADELLFNPPPLGTLGMTACTRCGMPEAYRHGEQPSQKGRSHQELYPSSTCDGVFRDANWSDFGRGTKEYAPE